jgi:site-specific DNA-methyltransferase (adenine-specific)
MTELRLGDCLDVMGSIPDGSIDLIACDLPFGTTACRWDHVIPFEPLWAHYRRLIKPRGAIVLNASQPFTSILVMSNPEWFRYEWIWDKVVGTNFQLANYRPLKSHESILVFSPAPAVFTKSGDCMAYYPQRTSRDQDDLRPYPKIRDSPMMRIRSGVGTPGKDYDPETKFPVSILSFHGREGECNGQRRLHSSQKPVALMEYLIKTYSKEGETILDNCMGSGTTGVACLNTGRNFIGIESDPGYFAVAERRIVAELDKTALFA